MMIAIEFESYGTIKKILNTVVSTAPFCHYYWNIPEYWIFSFGNGIEPDVYSPEGMARCIANLTEDEQAEVFTMFGATDEKNTTLCDTVPDYLEGVNEAIFVCWDSSRFEMFCKDEAALSALAKALLDAGLCKDHKINETSLENYGRTGFLQTIPLPRS